MGVNFGTPGVFNLFGGYASDGFGVKGFFGLPIFDYVTGYEVLVLYSLLYTENAVISLVGGVGHSDLSSYTAFSGATIQSYTWTQINTGVNTNWKELDAMLGLSFGKESFRSPQLTFGICYVHQFRKK